MHYSLSDYIADIAHNSIEAKAKNVVITFREFDEIIEIVVSDNGYGMDEETLRKAQDPFYTDPKKHAARKTGFGLPFLIQAAETCEGAFSINSEMGIGTEVRCTFGRLCIDTPPLGEIVSTVTALMAMDGCYELEFIRTYDSEEYSVKRSELLEALGELETAGSINMARIYVNSLEENIQHNKTGEA